MMMRLLAGALWMISAALGGCAFAGPAALSNGRSTYNAVINTTEDEQILSMIVRQRYDETFGMLAVSSVTASLKVSASFGANAGIGPRSGYEGNLVPLSAGVAYEENPTISYVPLRGEQFVERMLAPVSAEHTLLLSRMSTDEIEALRFLVRRANGLANPVYSSQAVTVGFDRFIELYTRLRERGVLDIIRSGDGQFSMLLHNYGDDEQAVGELLGLLGVRSGIEAGQKPGAPITVPLRFFVGAPDAAGIDLETPSALEIIGAAAAGVEVPGAHLDAGLARPGTVTTHELLMIHSSQTRPRDASVAVMHRGWWFSIDGRDTHSKQGFLLLRTLIGMRLDEAAAGQKAPVLTVPVGG